MSREVLKLRPRPEDVFPRFWLVWKRGSDKIHKRHPSPEAAHAEAMRLAGIHPDRTFYVLEATAFTGQPE